MKHKREENQHDNLEQVTRYYSKKESRVGYSLLLGGTKHYGYYLKGDKPWAFNRALRQMEEKLALALSVPPGSHVLDAGSGVGDVAAYLAANHHLKVTGIEILDANLREARRRAEERGLSHSVDFRRMSYSELDFPADHFDGVYTMETLVHAIDADKVLQEFWRVLKPGGRLVLFEYSRTPDREMSPRAARTLRQINEVAAMPSFQRFEHGVLSTLMTDAGFSNIDSEDISEHIWPMIGAFAALAAVPYVLAKLAGREAKFVNTVSAVEGWRYRRYWHYNIMTANK